MRVHRMLVERVDLRRLGRSTGGNDVLSDAFDRRQEVPSEKDLGPLARKGVQLHRLSRLRPRKEPQPGSSYRDHSRVTSRLLIEQIEMKFHFLYNKLGSYWASLHKGRYATSRRLRWGILTSSAREFTIHYRLA